MQKRTDNHIWDPSCAGHFPLGQSYKSAAVREFEEELGLKLSEEDFVELAKTKISSREIVNNRFITRFIVDKDIPLEEINFDRGEIEDVKYLSLIHI